MKKEFVKSLYFQIKDKVEPHEAIALKDEFMTITDDGFTVLSSIPLKDPNITLILSIFLGHLGIDRFYVGDIGLGVAKLLLNYFTLGLWWFIDIFFSYKKAKIYNASKIREYLPD